MSASDPNGAAARFAVALARALGAVHAAVALVLLAPATVPVALALVAGGGVFYATGRAAATGPHQAAAVRYAVPVGAALLVRLLVANPPGFDAAQAELVRFFAAVWRATPVPCYLLCVAYALAGAGAGSGGRPFAPPWR